MDKTKALQKLLDGTASEEEIGLLKQALASGEISIGGNVNHSVIIIGSGNTVELTPEALDRLNARPLLGGLDRDLMGKEIAFGLERLESELPLRAPVLLAQFQEQARRLRPSLKTSATSLSEDARKERVEALAVINSLCMEALDISFNALCLGEEPPEYDSRSPFRGLESFRPEDSGFFFGREALTRKLVGKINTHAFLAVLGASGSGKSSLVMAGLIPALDSEYVIFRPGTEPVLMLESVKLLVKKDELIVVDQFEELFTLTRDESTRREFIAKLLEASQKIVITLRSDFLGEVGAYRALSEEIQSHLEIVPPMDMDELRRAMEGQAGVVGLRFEADLSQQILDDVEGEPGAMPLLQHALWELWNRRHGRWLRASEYRAFGGVKQAITSTAEKAYGECTKAEQEQMRDIFLRLTRLDDSDEGRDTRRRVSLSDLIPSGRDMASITLLLDKFAKARLIVNTVNEDKTEIEVTHEALIRHWERLRNWSDDNRRFLIWRQKIIDRYLDWQKSKGELLQGSYLIEAENWLVEQGSQFSTGERKYIEESIAYRSNRQKLLSNLNKRVLLPYLFLTVIVAVIGVYVATRLVANTMRERLTNQLLEAGRVVSDNFVRQEVEHVVIARSVAFTAGLADALISEDNEAAASLVKPLFSGLGGENLILISPQGNELVHFVLNDGELQRVELDTGAAYSPIVTPFLTNRNVDEPPRRALGVNLVNDETYYYTSLPVSLNGEFSGVVVIGTSIRNILPYLKSTSLADIIFYGNNGQAIGSTLSAVDKDTLQTISISEGGFQTIIASENLVTGNNFSWGGRWYSLARGPLQVGNDRIGVFAVVLPLDFVIQSGLDSRTTYIVLFTFVLLLVMVVGFVGTRSAINPLYSLEKTSLALKNTSNREKRQWILFILFIPAGIFLMMIAGQIAVRIVPQWSVNAGMESLLDPKTAPKQKVGFVQPISSEILTPIGWFDTFLTPGIGSGNQDIVFPPFVVFEPRRIPSPSLSTDSPTATVTPPPTITSTPP